MTTDEGMKFAFIIAATEESSYWDPMTKETAEAIWDEWIARVRRDAALALAEHFSAEAIDQARQGNLDGADFYRAVAAEIEKQIPEETP